MIKHLRSKEEEKKLTKRDVYLLITEYCNKQIKDSQSKMLSEENFSLPSWSEFQAYQLGLQKAMFKVIEFLPNDHEGQTVK